MSVFPCAYVGTILYTVPYSHPPQSPDRERGPGRYAGATAAYEMASAGPRSLSTVRTPRAATPGRTPRFPSPREERGEGKGQEAELRPELARDAVAPRAPQFSFGKAAGREASRGAGEGTGSDAETHEGVEVGDGASEARTAQYGLVERRGDAGVVAWRGADAHGERARARRARLEAIAAARGVAAEALHYADVAVMGRPGRDDGVRPRAPAWSFGLPPNAVPPVRVPDTNSGDDGEGAGVPALVPVPNLDVVRPRLGGVVDFGLATGRVPRARRRVGARDRADRHEVSGGVDGECPQTCFVPCHAPSLSLWHWYPRTCSVPCASCHAAGSSHVQPGRGVWVPEEAHGGAQDAAGAGPVRVGAVSGTEGERKV